MGNYICFKIVFYDLAFFLLQTQNIPKERKKESKYNSNYANSKSKVIFLVELM